MINREGGDSTTSRAVASGGGAMILDFFFKFSNFENMNLIKIRNNSLSSGLQNGNFPVYVT